MMTKIKNMIRQAFVDFVLDDTNRYPTMQVIANSKAMKITHLSTYGIYSKPASGSHVLMFSSQGQEAVKFGIANDMLNGPVGMVDGEVAIMNPTSGATILLKADGTVVINGIVFDSHVHGGVEPGAGTSGGPQ